MKKLNLLLFVLLFALSLKVSAQQKTGFHVLRNLSVHSSGCWDYITIHGDGQLIFASHGNQVNIISTITGDSVGYISNTPSVQASLWLNLSHYRGRKIIIK